MTTSREKYEAWAAGKSVWDMTGWEIWQAAYAAGQKDQRERDAEICESILPANETSIWCVEEIRGQK